MAQRAKSCKRYDISHTHRVILDTLAICKKVLYDTKIEQEIRLIGEQKNGSNYKL